MICDSPSFTGSVSALPPFDLSTTQGYRFYSVLSAWAELPLCSFSLKVKTSSFSCCLTCPLFHRKRADVPRQMPQLVSSSCMLGEPLG